MASKRLDTPLNTGHFNAHRATSLKPYVPKIICYEPAWMAMSKLTLRPSRANQSSKLQSQVPRSFSNMNVVRYPPPPSVEDEVEALNKEHGYTISHYQDEESKCRGSVDQYRTIIDAAEVDASEPTREPVEASSDLRYVLVGDKDRRLSGNQSDQSGEATKSTKGKTEYEANTCRKFIIPSLAGEHAATPTAPDPELKRRKSRLDLPPIATEFEDKASRSVNRSKSASVYGHQGRDYFDGQDDKRPSGSGFLSPQVIKHATKGRERAYFDFQGGGSNPRGSGEERVRAERPTPSVSQHSQKRASSTIEIPQQSRRSAKKYNKEEVSSTRSSRRDLSPSQGSRRPSPPSQPARRRSSPTRERERDKLSRRNSTYRGSRDSPPREDGYPSDTESVASRRTNRERRKSIVMQEPSALLSPDRPPAISRPKSRNGVLPSPRVSQTRMGDPGSENRPPVVTVASKDRRRRQERSVSPYKQESPSNRSGYGDSQPRPMGPRSRPQSFVGLAPVAVPLATVAMNAPTSNGWGHDGRGSPLVSPTTSRQNSLEGSPPRDRSRHSPYIPTTGSSLDSPTSEMSRRFSEDTNPRLLSALLKCRGKDSISGYNYWFTFRKSDSFNVCPDCYTLAIQPTEFREELVPAPMRAADRRIVCEFGASHWHSIALSLSSRHHQPDLRLLKDVAQVLDRNKPCPGERKTVRSWYSLRDPANRYQAMADFYVCKSCVQVLEVLLPNMNGIMCPIENRDDSTKRPCSLYFNPKDPSRFLSYFDLLESEAVEAKKNSKAPDIRPLAERFHAINSARDCQKERFLANREWYAMRSLPDFTVCQQCFEYVVHPQLDQNNAVARDFFLEPIPFDDASCHLYSPRMRSVFAEACQNNDLEYLAYQVTKRREREAEINKAIDSVSEAADAGRISREAAQRMIDDLTREWKDEYE